VIRSPIEGRCGIRQIDQGNIRRMATILLAARLRVSFDRYDHAGDDPDLASNCVSRTASR
jgi:hypothetical protein